MSEAPTHSAGVPIPSRPQQTERTPQTDRMPQQPQRPDAQRTEAQRTEAQRTEAQRTDAQRTDAERTEAQRSEHQRTDAQRTDAQRTEHERGEQHRTSEQLPRSQRTEELPSSKLEDEWKAVQYEFVDDPKSAVRKADDLVTRALEELNTRHRSLTKQLEGNGDPQTEDLRLALHRYRELFKSLVAVK